MLTADLINLQQLQAKAGPQAARAGHVYYLQERARVVSVEERRAVIAVRGSQPRPYLVSVVCDQHWLTLSCTCSQAAGGVACKHSVAAAYQLHDHLTAHPPNPWRQVFTATLDQPRRRANAALLLFSLARRDTVWALTPYIVAGRALPESATADSRALLDALQSPDVIRQAKIPRAPLQPRHAPGASAAELALANMILSLSQMYYADPTIQSPETLNTLLPLLPPGNVFTGSDARPFLRRLRTTAERGQVGLHGTHASQGLVVAPTLRIGGETVLLDHPALTLVLPKHHWAIHRDVLFQYDDPGELLASFQRHRQLTIPAADQTEFIEHYLLPMAERTPLSGDLPSQRAVSAAPQPRLYLREADNELVVEVRFGYGEHEVLCDPQHPAETAAYSPAALALIRIARQPEIEERFWREALRHGLKRGLEPGVATLRSGTSIVTFLISQVPKLAAAGFEIYGEEALRSARVNRHAPSLTFRVASGLDWFELETVVRFGAAGVDFAELRHAIQKRERYIKLADGTIGEIPASWLERYRRLFAISEVRDEQLLLKSHHLTILDELLEESDQVDAEFVRRRERLQSGEIAPRDLPLGFAGILRPYQKAGYDWLHFLHEHGFGGCLADDMGTGKTIQALAFLQALKASGHATASTLLVLPRSLIFNWQREIARWTPGLRVLVHADQGRASAASGFAEVDLVLTTYGTMLRDSKLLAAYQFHYVVLDEAQAIKNPASQTARAARALRADHRLALTGTPVENATLELWSLFAFLNPGMLGSLDFFRAEFAGPIEKDGDERTADLLRRMVSPFILRRTKAQVAPDLPARDERVIVCAMEPAQARIYQRYRDQYRALLLDLIDTERLSDLRLRVLEGLLRLRQICNHPRLVEPTFRGQSAKFERLLDVLDTLRSEGHKVLVFSQFVQMLSLLREQLDQRGVSYAYLDGQTRDRAAVVDAFHSDPAIPLFLISLKAGGVGLNLTAADYVIHIDPWWNPAVEQQATDRAHRIGQEKPVFIYKLIVRDTVEEKILHLQERKRALADQLIANEPGIIKTLTREDVAELFS